MLPNSYDDIRVRGLASGEGDDAIELGFSAKEVSLGLPSGLAIASDA